MLFSPILLAQDESAETSEPKRPAELIKLWQELTPKLDEILVLEAQQDTLPETAFFGADKQSNRESIDALIAEANAILALPSGEDYRGRIRLLNADIERKEQEIARYQQQRVIAPKEALWQQTSADFTAAIQVAEQQVARLHEQIAVIKAEFATELRSLGIHISDEQLDFLLSDSDRR